MPTKLPDFEGQEVSRTAVAITNAGDGLSNAMKVKPTVLHLGKEVYVLMKCEVAKVRHEENGDSGSLTRVHVLKAGTATIVTKKFAEESIKAQEAEIERAKDAAAGVARIPGTAPYGDEGDDGDGAEPEGDEG